jgi:hypothetical protein
MTAGGPYRAEAVSREATDPQEGAVPDYGVPSTLPAEIHRQEQDLQWPS